MVITLVIICLILCALSATLFVVNRLQAPAHRREIQHLERTVASQSLELTTTRKEYAAREAEMWQTVRACLDRRMLVLGTSPLQESVYQDQPPAQDAPETIEDMRRMLADEQRRPGLGGLAGKIANRRELVMALRDMEEAEGNQSPTPRTFAQPQPFDPTADVGAH
jgi:hypothetical protein